MGEDKPPTAKDMHGIIVCPGEIQGKQRGI
jgi:hypothetical protein